MSLEGARLDVIFVRIGKKTRDFEVVLTSNDREPITVHTVRYRKEVPRWMVALKILRNEEWFHEFYYTNSTWNRIRKLLAEINRQHGTNFKLERSLPEEEDDGRARISLVGG